jgi:hypothetical protein
MATLQSLPYWQVLDDQGLPAAGAQIYAYYVGTSTPRDTYTTYQGNIPSAWPVVCDSAGKAIIFLGAGLYKFIITDSLNNIIKMVDGVGGQGQSIVVSTVVGSVNSLKALAPNIVQYVVCLGYHTVGDGGGGAFYWGANITSGQDDGAIVAPTNPDVLNPGSWIRVFDGDAPANILVWGAQAGQNADVAFSNALTFCANNERALLIPTGTFYLNSDPGFSANIPVEFDPEGIISYSNIFHPSITPVIGRDDVSQHFAVQYVPNFSAGTEVRPEWFTDRISTADYSLAIQQSMDSVTLNNGVVRIPDGYYSILGQLTPRDNVTLIGQGPDSIIAPGNAFTDALLMDGTANNASISNISFNGLDSTNYMGLRIVGTNLNIDNNRFDNMYYPLTVGGVSGIQGSNIRVSENSLTSSSGAALLIGTGGVDVVDNDIYNTEDVPAIVQYGNATGDIHIKDNNITMSTGGGWTNAVIINSDTLSGIVEVRDNVILGDGTCNDSGIKVSDTEKTVTIDDNHLFSATLDGSSYGTAIEETGLDPAIFYGPGNIMSGFQNEYITTLPRYIDIGNDLEVEINGDMTALNNLQVNNNLTVDATTYLNDMSANGANINNLHTTNFSFGPTNVSIQAARTFPCVVGTAWPFTSSIVTDSTIIKPITVTYQEFFNLIAINVPYFQITMDGGDPTDNTGFFLYPYLQSAYAQTLTINTGALPITISSNLQVRNGEDVQITSLNNSAKYMRGTVTTYDPTTGDMTANITAVGSGGSDNSWNVAFREFPPEFPTNSASPCLLVTAVTAGGVHPDLASAPGQVQMNSLYWRPSISYVYTSDSVGSEFRIHWQHDSTDLGWVAGMGGITNDNPIVKSGQTILTMTPSV